MMGCVRRVSRSCSSAILRNPSIIGCSLRTSPAALPFVVLCLNAATPLAAQNSTTEGFTLGLHAGSVSVYAGEADRATGGGGGLLLGYGLTRGLTIFGRVDGANIELEDAASLQGTWTMGHVDLGVRLHFANPRRSLAPYVEAALTRHIVEVKDLPQPNAFDTDRIRFSDGTLTLGGGVMIYSGETLAFDIGGLVSSGAFTEATVGATRRAAFDLNARSIRLNIGVAWWL